MTRLTRFSYNLYIMNILSILSKKGNSYTIEMVNKGKSCLMIKHNISIHELPRLSGSRFTVQGFNLEP